MSRKKKQTRSENKSRAEFSDAVQSKTRRFAAHFRSGKTIKIRQLLIIVSIVRSPLVWFTSLHPPLPKCTFKVFFFFFFLEGGMTLERKNGPVPARFGPAARGRRRAVQVCRSGFGLRRRRRDMFFLRGRREVVGKLNI